MVEFFGARTEFGKRHDFITAVKIGQRIKSPFRLYSMQNNVLWGLASCWQVRYALAAKKMRRVYNE